MSVVDISFCEGLQNGTFSLISYESSLGPPIPVAHNVTS